MQPLQSANDGIEFLFVQSSEALVQEEEAERVLATQLNLGRQRESERQRGKERLPTGKRVHSAPLPAIEVITNDEIALPAGLQSVSLSRETP